MNRPFVTVVSGLPRSGTSLMMQMLQAGGMAVLTDLVRAADQDNPRGYLELEAVKRTKQDASWVEQAVGKAVKVIHLLVPDLPPQYDYRVLVMRRDISEVLQSQRRLLTRQGRRGAELSDVQLGQLYAAQLSKVIGWMGAQKNFLLLEVDYHDLIVDPDKSAHRVNAFINNALDETAMVAAIDRSLYRSGRPEHSEE